MNVLRRIVLGPCPCQGCSEPLTWNGYAWENAVGDRHFCDNGRDEYSVSIGYPAQRPASRLYSESRGACVREYRPNA